MTAPGAKYLATTPGSIGNLGPGLDVLGCALAGARDEVIAEWSRQPGVSVLDAGHAEWSRSSSRHTAALAAGGGVLARQGHGRDGDCAGRRAAVEACGSCVAAVLRRHVGVGPVPCRLPDGGLLAPPGGCRQGGGDPGGVPEGDRGGPYRVSDARRGDDRRGVPKDGRRDGRQPNAAAHVAGHRERSRSRPRLGRRWPARRQRRGPYCH